jgi:NAD(P)H-flavin reductase
MSNVSPQDTLLLGEFEELMEKHPEQFKAWSTVSKSDSDRKYSSGSIDEKMLREHVHDPSNSRTGSFFCGPPPLVEKVLRPMFLRVGATDGVNLFGF